MHETFLDQTIDTQSFPFASSHQPLPRPLSFLSQPVWRYMYIAFDEIPGRSAPYIMCIPRSMTDHILMVHFSTHTRNFPIHMIMICQTNQTTSSEQWAVSTMGGCAWMKKLLAGRNRKRPSRIMWWYVLIDRWGSGCRECYRARWNWGWLCILHVECGGVLQ